VVETQGGSELRADWIIGSNVVSPEGESIGAIEDIILDSESGEVSAAVLGVGGFLGFGGKSIAVDWAELQVEWDGEEITLNLTREEAEEAPEYEFREREVAPPPEPATGAGGGTMGGTPPAPAPSGGVR
jgi:sporulation protein YlmC with PRC-barrel domain